MEEEFGLDLAAVPTFAAEGNTSTVQKLTRTSRGKVVKFATKMKADLKTAQSAVSALQHRIKKLNRDVAKKEISSDPTDVASKETSSEPIAMVLAAVDDMEEEIILQLAAVPTYAEEGNIQTVKTVTRNSKDKIRNFATNMTKGLKTAHWNVYALQDKIKDL